MESYYYCFIQLVSEVYDNITYITAAKSDSSVHIERYIKQKVKRSIVTSSEEIWRVPIERNNTE